MAVNPVRSQAPPEKSKPVGTARKSFIGTKMEIRWRPVIILLSESIRRSTNDCLAVRAKKERTRTIYSPPGEPNGTNGDVTVFEPRERSARHRQCFALRSTRFNFQLQLRPRNVLVLDKRRVGCVRSVILSGLLLPVQLLRSGPKWN